MLVFIVPSAVYAEVCVYPRGCSRNNICLFFSVSNAVAFSFMAVLDVTLSGRNVVRLVCVEIVSAVVLNEDLVKILLSRLT